VYYSRGNAFRAAGNNDDAIRDYDQALRLHPGVVETYTNRGIAYRAKGEYAEAIEDFDEALRLKPDQPIVLNNRGITYRYKGDFRRAIEDLNQALRLDPEYALSYKGRGVAYFLTGEFVAAADDLAEYLNRQPEDHHAVLLLFLARQRAGADGAAELKFNVIMLDVTEWPGPIVEFFAGQRSESTLRGAAEDPDASIREVRLCELEFYLGQWNLTFGSSAEARQKLEHVREICPRTSFPFQAAQTELARMGD
ncbi:MAG: tetratricopeptide repeat protein, partial [Dongiaceae bacterium]